MPREIIQAVPYADGKSRRLVLAWGWEPRQSDVVALLEVHEYDPAKWGEQVMKLGPDGHQQRAENWDCVSSVPLFRSEVENLIRSVRRAEKFWNRALRSQIEAEAQPHTCGPGEACSSCPSPTLTVTTNPTGVDYRVV